MIENNQLTAYFNGVWMPYGEVRIEPSDRGFEKGDAVFEATRTFNGELFRLQEHLIRLYRSLRAARIDPGLSVDEMRDITVEVLARSSQHLDVAGDFQVYHFVTRGKGAWAHESGSPTVCVKVAPINFAKFRGVYDDGVHGVVTRTRSFTAASLDPRIKHYSRMNFNLAELEAHDVDPKGWPILTDSDGRITEGTTYNVFCVSGGRLTTAPGNRVLEGVSRGVVMELEAAAGRKVREGDLEMYDLINADEVFFTGTSPCVIPVTKVNNCQVADGKPGPMTQDLLRRWSELAGVDIVAQSTAHAG